MPHPDGSLSFPYVSVAELLSHAFDLNSTLDKSGVLALRSLPSDYIIPHITILRTTFSLLSLASILETVVLMEPLILLSKTVRAPALAFYLVKLFFSDNLHQASFLVGSLLTSNLLLRRVTSLIVQTTNL